MENIQCFVDKQGNQRAILIDMSIWSPVWDNFCDVIITDSREE